MKESDLYSEIARLRGIIERQIKSMHDEVDRLEGDTLVSISESIYNRIAAEGLALSADRLEKELNDTGK